MNPKQFELLNDFYLATKETKSRISELRIAIEKELSEMKEKILSLYNHEEDIMYLICFDGSCFIDFYKVTKKRKIQIHVAWLSVNDGFSFSNPNTLEEAELIIQTMNNPTHCEIRDYITFGYFDDINNRYDREDWISEETHNGKFLFNIEKEIFVKALDMCYNLYSK